MPLRKTSDTTKAKDKKAYKYCGLPTEEQMAALNNTLGAARFLYNRMLADKSFCYKLTGENLCLTPAWYKHVSNLAWLKDADSLALANVQLQLNTAFLNFFEKRADYPTFKKKSKHEDSYTTNHASVRFDGKTAWLLLPKVPGEIKLIYHRPIRSGGELKSVTVSHDATGRYYFSLLYAYPHHEAKHDIDPDKAIGLDMTMHGLYVDSNGNAGAYADWYHTVEDRIAKEQRKLSRMKKGSANYEKQRRKVACLYAKAKHQRADFLHKLSRRLVDTYDIIGIEDLNMRSMSKSLNFGKSVGDKGWGMFVRMLVYKAAAEGKKVIKVDKFFPSSQTCHECGTLHKKVKDLSVREWTCPVCGHHHGRDENAALNIRDEAVRIYCTC